MNKYLPRVRLYPEQDEDRQILSWLGMLPDRAKSPAIKKALLQGIQSPVTRNTHQALDVDALRRDFLPDIRRVIDAALQQVTLQHPSSAGQPANHELEAQQDEDEIEGMLVELELSFMLEEEDEAWPPTDII